MAAFASIHFFVSRALLIFVCTLTITVSPSNSRVAEKSTGNIGVCGDWCYDEELVHTPDNEIHCDTPNWWIDHDCISGDRQSPINIPGDIQLSEEKSHIYLSPQYFSSSIFEVANNGHSASISPQKIKEFTMTGSRLEGSYVLAGIHFHWGGNNSIGSEHQVAGQSFTMEGHIVHHKTKYASLDDALGSDDKSAVAVLGIFYQVVANYEGENNIALKGVIDALSLVQEADGVSTRGMDLTLRDLLPTNSEAFNYDGSLTTPCCDQRVFWTVFKNPMPVSASQMDAFRRLKYHNGHNLVNNYRGPQPLNNRTIDHSLYGINIQTLGSPSSAHGIAQIASVSFIIAVFALLL